MAPRCRMQSRECDGCGACIGMYGEEEAVTPLHPTYCEECHEEIEDGYYYDVEGTVLCKHCIDKLYQQDAAAENDGLRCDVCTGPAVEDGEYYRIGKDTLCSFCVDMLYQKEELL